MSRLPIVLATLVAPASGRSQSLGSAASEIDAWPHFEMRRVSVPFLIAGQFWGFGSSKQAATPTLPPEPSHAADAIPASHGAHATPADEPATPTEKPVGGPQLQRPLKPGATEPTLQKKFEFPSIFGYKSATSPSHSPEAGAPSADEHSPEAVTTNSAALDGTPGALVDSETMVPEGAAGESAVTGGDATHASGESSTSGVHADVASNLDDVHPNESLSNPSGFTTDGSATADASLAGDLPTVDATVTDHAAAPPSISGGPADGTVDVAPADNSSGATESPETPHAELLGRTSGLDHSHSHSPSVAAADDSEHAGATETGSHATAVPASNESDAEVVRPSAGASTVGVGTGSASVPPTAAPSGPVAGTATTASRSATAVASSSSLPIAASDAADGTRARKAAGSGLQPQNGSDEAAANDSLGSTEAARSANAVASETDASTEEAASEPNADNAVSGLEASAAENAEHGSIEASDAGVADAAESVAEAGSGDPAHVQQQQQRQQQRESVAMEVGVDGIPMMVGQQHGHQQQPAVPSSATQRHMLGQDGHGVYRGQRRDEMNALGHAHPHDGHAAHDHHDHHHHHEHDHSHGHHHGHNGMEHAYAHIPTVVMGSGSNLHKNRTQLDAQQHDGNETFNATNATRAEALSLDEHAHEHHHDAHVASHDEITADGTGTHDPAHADTGADAAGWQSDDDGHVHVMDADAEAALHHWAALKSRRNDSALPSDSGSEPALDDDGSGVASASVDHVDPAAAVAADGAEHVDSEGLGSAPHDGEHDPWTHHEQQQRTVATTSSKQHVNDSASANGTTAAVASAVKVPDIHAAFQQKQPSSSSSSAPSHAAPRASSSSSPSSLLLSEPIPPLCTKYTDRIVELESQLSRAQSSLNVLPALQSSLRTASALASHAWEAVTVGYVNPLVLEPLQPALAPAKEAILPFLEDAGQKWDEHAYPVLHQHLFDESAPLRQAIGDYSSLFNAQRDAIVSWLEGQEHPALSMHGRDAIDTATTGATLTLTVLTLYILWPILRTVLCISTCGLCCRRGGRGKASTSKRGVAGKTGLASAPRAVPDAARFQLQTPPPTPFPGQSTAGVAAGNGVPPSATKAGMQGILSSTAPAGGVTPFGKASGDHAGASTTGGAGVMPLLPPLSALPPELALKLTNMGLLKTPGAPGLATSKKHLSKTGRGKSAGPGTRHRHATAAAGAGADGDVHATTNLARTFAGAGSAGGDADGAANAATNHSSAAASGPAALANAAILRGRGLGVLGTGSNTGSSSGGGRHPITSLTSPPPRLASATSSMLQPPQSHRSTLTLEESGIASSTGGGGASVATGSASASVLGPNGALHSPSRRRGTTGQSSIDRELHPNEQQQHQQFDDAESNAGGASAEPGLERQMSNPQIPSEIVAAGAEAPKPLFVSSATSAGYVSSPAGAGTFPGIGVGGGGIPGSAYPGSATKKKGSARSVGGPGPVMPLHSEPGLRSAAAGGSHPPPVAIASDDGRDHDNSSIGGLEGGSVTGGGAHPFAAAAGSSSRMPTPPPIVTPSGSVSGQHSLGQQPLFHQHRPGSVSTAAAASGPGSASAAGLGVGRPKSGSVASAASAGGGGPGFLPMHPAGSAPPQLQMGGMSNSISGRDSSYSYHQQPTPGSIDGSQHHQLQHQQAQGLTPWSQSGHQQSHLATPASDGDVMPWQQQPQQQQQLQEGHGQYPDQYTPDGSSYQQALATPGAGAAAQFEPQQGSQGQQGQLDYSRYQHELDQQQQQYQQYQDPSAIQSVGDDDSGNAMMMMMNVGGAEMDASQQQQQQDVQSEQAAGALLGDAGLHPSETVEGTADAAAAAGGDTPAQEAWNPDALQFLNSYDEAGNPIYGYYQLAVGDDGNQYYQPVQVPVSFEQGPDGNLVPVPLPAQVEAAELVPAQLNTSEL